MEKNQKNALSSVNVILISNIKILRWIDYQKHKFIYKIYYVFTNYIYLDF